MFQDLLHLLNMSFLVISFFCIFLESFWLLFLRSFLLQNSLFRLLFQCFSLFFCFIYVYKFFEFLFSPNFVIFFYNLFSSLFIRALWFFNGDWNFYITMKFFYSFNCYYFTRNFIFFLFSECLS